MTADPLHPERAPVSRSSTRSSVTFRAVLLYLHGFASGPSSNKARFLSERFRALGIPMEIPDLTPGADGFERSSPSSMLAIAEAGGEEPRLVRGGAGGEAVEVEEHAAEGIRGPRAPPRPHPAGAGGPALARRVLSAHPGHREVA